ncbi:MAG: GrxA family glutaredoxin [Pseudomonadaceae bacterium]|nr:GrxA family glutaredoxin [Pseudomonadaceae bacterium]
MNIVIFGRPGCPFCVRAVELAEKLEASQGATHRYIDIHAEGITKEDMEKTIGKPVETVPQVFFDKTHIGGYTEMEAHARSQGWI